LREKEGLGARVLESLDITLAEVQGMVSRIVGQGDEAISGQIPFTPRAKRVLELSLREATLLGHNSIGTEHILLGIARENEGVASRILLDFGADAEKIRAATIKMVPGHFPGGYPDKPLPAAERTRPFPHGEMMYSRAGRDNTSVVITGAAIATAGLGIGLALGWLIWG
jgi:ATP-dependent Clp protease ATP-binding subunit ClpC